MKDKHTIGGKMARNSRKIAILLLLFVLIQTISMATYPFRETNLLFSKYSKNKMEINKSLDLGLHIGRQKQF